MSLHKLVAFEASFVPFCNLCEKELVKGMVLDIYCIETDALIRVYICVDCAKKLHQELTEVLHEIER